MSVTILVARAAILFFDRVEHTFEVVHIIVLEVQHTAATQLNTLSDGIVHALITAHNTTNHTPPHHTALRNINSEQEKREGGSEFTR